MPRGIFKNSKERAKKIGDAHRGRKLSKEHRLKLSLAKRGKISPMKGKKHSKETIKKLSESHKGHKHSDEQRMKIGLKSKGNKYRLGKRHTDESKNKISKALEGKYIREKSSNWQGGKSFEEYGLDFNRILRIKIRKRDNYTCQECNYTEKRLGYKLSVHHIDYNKKNNKLNNLIGLCRNCHGQTNFKRNDWKEYFKKKISVDVNAIS